MFKIGLGSEVKDRVTGFAGVVTSRTEWMNGCIRYGVQPKKLEKGKMADAVAFDEEQLIVVKPADLTKDKWDRTGGPHPMPTRAAAPR